MNLILTVILGNIYYLYYDIGLRFVGKKIKCNNKQDSDK